MLKNKPVEMGDTLRVTQRLGKKDLKKAEDDPIIEVTDGTITFLTRVESVGRILEDGKEQWVVGHHAEGMPYWLVRWKGRKGQKRRPCFPISSDEELIKVGKTGETFGIISFEKV